MKKTNKTVAVLAAVTILGATGVVWAQNTYTRTSAGINLSDDTSAWSPAGVPGSLDVASWVSASSRGAAGNLVNTDITWAGITVAGGGELSIGSNGPKILSIGAQGIDMSAATATVTLNNKVAFIADQTWTIAGGRSLTAARRGISAGSGNITIARSGTGTATIHVKPPNDMNDHTGDWRIGNHVELQFYRNTFLALGTGSVTLEDGATLTQSDGNWELRNNLVLGTSVGDTVTIGSRSPANSPRMFKLTGVMSGPGNVVFPNLVPDSMNSLNKSGYFLTDTNTFTGSMTIDSGAVVRIGGVDDTDTKALQADNTGSIDPLVAVINNGKLVFGRNDAHTFPNTITGEGGVYIGGKVGEVIDGTDTQSLTLTGTNSYSGGTFMVSRQLSIPTVSALGNAPLELSSGTLTYTGAGESTSLSLVINNSPVTISITESAAELAWSDSAAKTQSITKDGAGTLLLGGPLTGNGALTINAGRLSLTSASNTRSASTLTSVNSGSTFALPDSGSWLGGIDVLSNATFDVSERVTPFALSVDQRLTLYANSSVTGMLSVAAGSTLTFDGAPQTKTIEDVTFKSDLLLAGGSVCFDLANSPAGISDKVQIAGALKLSASAKTTVSINAGLLSSGRYPLCIAVAIQDADTGDDLNLTAENFTDYLNLEGTPATTQIFALITGDGMDGTAVGVLYLTVTGDTPVLTWNGTSEASDWTISTDVLNWLDDTSVSVSYANDYAVLFRDEAAAKQVNLPGTVTPGQIRFDNTQAYTLSGAGAISGKADLFKSGTGTVTFANSTANTFTGDITISGGTLEAESFTKHLGSGGVNFEAATGDSGCLRVTAPAETLTCALNLPGNNATGTLDLVSGNLTWAAGEGEVAGTLLKRGAGKLNLSGEACVIEGGLSIEEGSTTLTDGAARTAAIDIKNSASLLIDTGASSSEDLQMTGSISGTGTLTTRNRGRNILLYSDMSNFNSTIVLDDSLLALMNAKSTHSGVNIQLNEDQGRRTVFVIGEAFAGSVAEIGSLNGRGLITVRYNHIPGVRTLKINQSVDGLWYGSLEKDPSTDRDFAMIKGGAGVFGIIKDVIRPYALQIIEGDVDIGAGTEDGTHYGSIALSAADARILWRRSDASTVAHAAPISGIGSVFIDGAASIVLAGANTYSGTTVVSNGTLLVNGSHVGGGDYTIASGATFGGSGSVALAGGTVNLLTGARIAPGSLTGEGRTLTVSSLTLAPGAGVALDAAGDQVVVTESVILNNNSVTPAHIAALDENTRYPILTCTGTITGKLATRVGDGSWVISRKGNTFYLQYNVGTLITIR